jgi:putative spermidine/putrescine transport system permease protein
MARNGARRFDLAAVCGRVAGVVAFVFMGLPILVVVLSAFSPTAFPEFPPSGISFEWFEEVFTKRAWVKAIKTSLTLLLMVTPLSVVLGTCAAYGLHRVRFRGRELLQSFLMSPLMIPQIVLGIALLYVFSALGVTGSLWTMAVGQTVVCIPYVLRCVNASLASFDGALENASMSLGAGPWTTFRRVTLPLIRPGVVAGTVFAAVTSFGEVSISLFLSSPTAMPVSVRIFNYIEQTFDPAVTAVSAIFIFVSVVVLFVIDRTVGLAKAM